VACTIAMNVELRKIGEAARYLSLSSIVPNRILSKDTRSERASSPALTDQAEIRQA
jgi:hypothetical protein